MLRLIFVTGSLGIGGAEQHSITLMNRLAERGHECHAVYVKNDAALAGRIRLHERGTLRCLDAERFLDLRAVSEFARQIERIRPSAIVVANPYPLMYAALAMHQAGRRMPLLATYHSTRNLGLKEHVRMLIDRCFIMMAYCLVFVSENQARYWRRRAVFCRQIKVIHNGIDADLFKPESWRAEASSVRKQFGYSESDRVFGMVAMLRPEKNHVQLLAAIARLRAAGLPARALLIGDGPMRAAIEATARTLKIESFVDITGYREDVRPYLAACDAVVLCSITEALSLAAIEAMAMGKPLIHSEVGGANELVVPGHNGYLFPVGDTDALVQRLWLLADRDEAERMGCNGRRVIEEKFSERNMVNRYEQTLVDLCDRKTETRRLASQPAPQDESPAVNN
jgi:glycosyltransferase involved in cell wall biosynthesis